MPDHTRGANSAASGRLAMAVRTQPLRDASPGSPFRMVGSWVAALHRRWRCSRSRTLRTLRKLFHSVGASDDSEAHRLMPSMSSSAGRLRQCGGTPLGDI